MKTATLQNYKEVQVEWWGVVTADSKVSLSELADSSGWPE